MPGEKAQSPVRLLVIDGDASTVRTVAAQLPVPALEVVAARTGRAGVSRAGRDEPELILVALDLPDGDGVETCRRIRQLCGTVALVVLAPMHAGSRILDALDAGADDFITTPLDVTELRARLRVALAHRTMRDGPPLVVEAGPLRIDFAACSVAVDGRPVKLTAREFDMLAYLARHPGEFVDYPRLLALVASTSEAHGHAALRHLARGLRRKLDAPVLEVTVGVGWRLAVPTVMSQAATGPAA